MEKHILAQTRLLWWSSRVSAIISIFTVSVPLTKTRMKTSGQQGKQAISNTNNVLTTANIELCFATTVQQGVEATVVTLKPDPFLHEGGCRKTKRWWRGRKTYSYIFNTLLRDFMICCLFLRQRVICSAWLLSFEKSSNAAPDIHRVPLVCMGSETLSSAATWKAFLLQVKDSVRGEQKCAGLSR